MSKPLTEEEVVDRAKKWARFYRNEKTRARMDAVLEDLSKSDQRRVYLCGQRIVGGLPIKVIPTATNEKGVEHANASAKDSKTRQPNESHKGHRATKK
jgi:hypothetical protein